MLAAKEASEPLSKSSESPTTLSSPQQRALFRDKTNWLIPEEKTQMERNTTLDWEGTLKKLIYSREKTPNGEKVKFPAVKCQEDLFCGPLVSQL